MSYSAPQTKRVSTHYTSQLSHIWVSLCNRFIYPQHRNLWITREKLWKKCLNWGKLDPFLPIKAMHSPPYMGGGNCRYLNRGCQLWEVDKRNLLSRFLPISNGENFDVESPAPWALLLSITHIFCEFVARIKYEHIIYFVKISVLEIIDIGLRHYVGSH